MASLPRPTREELDAVVDRVETWLGDREVPGVVVGFLGMAEEIDMTPLARRLPQIRFGLTRTAPGLQMTVHPIDSQRERHRFGFDQPSGASPEIDQDEVEIVLVPGMAFDRQGNRLGRGAGYYDRFLARVAAETVALTTERQILDSVPSESHDVRVDWIATEAGVQAVTAR